MRWAAGEEPATAEESENRDILLEDGFLVRERAEDDARVRAYLDKAREGIPGTMFVTLMPTLQCNLACNYCFRRSTPRSRRCPRRPRTPRWNGSSGRWTSAG